MINYIAQRHCFKRGFKIYPELTESGKYRIKYEIANFAKYYMNGKNFNKKESFEAIWELYNKIYEKDKQKGLI